MNTTTDLPARLNNRRIIRIEHARCWAYTRGLHWMNVLALGSWWEWIRAAFRWAQGSSAS